MHGFYVPRKNEYVLFDFLKKMREAERIEPMHPEVLKRYAESKTPLVTRMDYEIVEMQCPHCEFDWRQHKYPVKASEKVYCPNCGASIEKEKALEKKDSDQRTIDSDWS